MITGNNTNLEFTETLHDMTVEGYFFEFKELKHRGDVFQLVISQQYFTFISFIQFILNTLDVAEIYT